MKQSTKAPKVVKQLERGEKTQMILRFLKAGNKTITEIRHAMAKKGYKVYDSEVRRLAQ